jgi:peptide/nickel transport system permease protein
MGAARVLRGEVAVLRTFAFVDAAHALGSSSWRVFGRHLVPHLTPVLMVNASISVGTSMLTESALSFVGLGVQPPVASWGNMLSGAQNSLLTNPLLAIYPGLMIFATVATANSLGDALRRQLPH